MSQKLGRKTPEAEAAGSLQQDKNCPPPPAPPEARPFSRAPGAYPRHSQPGPQPSLCSGCLPQPKPLHWEWARADPPSASHNHVTCKTAPSSRRTRLSLHEGRALVPVADVPPLTEFPRQPLQEGAVATGSSKEWMTWCVVCGHAAREPRSLSSHPSNPTWSLCLQSWWLGWMDGWMKNFIPLGWVTRS